MGRPLELAVGFLELRESSEPHASGARGFFRRHAAPEVVLREHLEMGLKLVLEVLIHAGGAKATCEFGRRALSSRQAWAYPRSATRSTRPTTAEIRSQFCASVWSRFRPALVME